jgi:GNAT superfamily N-acetyltransferase
LDIDDEITVAPLGPADLGAAAAVAARGMRDNPLHLAVIGNDPDRRARLMRAVFLALLSHGRRWVLGAFLRGRLIGVAAYAEPGRCQPTVRQLPSLLRPAAGFGFRAPRALRWLTTWARHDPREPHSHLGPVAVAPDMHGQGIGSRLLQEYVDECDEAGELAYLETDKSQNVRFYQRFGFSVADQAKVVGVQNWFMTRKPQPGPD